MQILTILTLITSILANASGTIAENFIVREIEGKTAVLEGKVKEVKAGDKIYYGRSPFQFVVESVKENEVVIKLPDSATDVKVGSVLLRQPTDAIKKSILTESRLKEALGE